MEKTESNWVRLRVLTPVLLFLLTVISSLGAWSFQELRAEVRHTCEIIQTHLQDPEIHYASRKDIQWIKQFLVLNGNKRE